MIIKDLKQCPLKNAVRQQSFPCSHTMGPFDIIEKVHDIAYYHIDMPGLTWHTPCGFGVGTQE